MGIPLIGSTPTHKGYSLSPKLRQPELLTPGRKPVGNVKIDWSNPLTRGLIRAWYFQPGNRLVDLVAGQSLSINGDVDFRVTGETGRTNYSAYVPANGYMDCAGEGVQNQLADQMTAFIDIEANTAGNQSGCLFGSVAASAGTYDWMVFITSASPWEYYAYVVNDIDSIRQTGPMTSPSGVQSTTIAMTYDGANITLYGDGEVGPTPTTQTENIRATAGHTINLDRWNSANDEIIAYKVALIYDRGLSAEEIKMLHDNPYQFLIPVTG